VRRSSAMLSKHTWPLMHLQDRVNS
jgi:hypothetical protein